MGKKKQGTTTDKLVEDVEKYAAGPDKGKKFFQELAAKQLAVFKGLGFAAGYLGGMAKAETFGQIIDIAQSYGENDWREFIKEIQYAQPDEFFLFEHAPKTGLCDSKQMNREYLDSLKHPRRSKEVNLNYRLSRLVHTLFFTRDKGLWGLLRRIYGRWSKKPGASDPELFTERIPYTETRDYVRIVMRNMQVYAALYGL